MFRAYFAIDIDAENEHEARAVQDQASGVLLGLSGVRTVRGEPLLAMAWLPTVEYDGDEVPA